MTIIEIKYFPMAKQIQQSTFDDVVNENMEEFDMSREDAIEDAVTQFESQGVDLSNIVRDMSGIKTSDDLNAEQHFVVSTINTLRQMLEHEPPLFDIIAPALQSIRDECAKDLSYRCLAGKNDGYPVLLRCLEICIENHNTDVLVITLNAFCNFCDGQPDFLDAKCTEIMLKLIDDFTPNCDIVALAVKFLRLNCVKHEKNRVDVFQRNIIEKLVTLMFMNDSVILMEACKFIRVMTYDDDQRVPFGKGQEHARQMVCRYNLLVVISDFIAKNVTDPTILSELMLTLSKLSVRDEFCKDVYNTGILSVIINSIQRHIDSLPMVLSACILLKCLAGNDKVKCEIVNSGGASALHLVFSHYQGNATVSEAACGLTAALSLRNPGLCPALLEADLHHSIVQVMKIHHKSTAMQKIACMAIRNIVSHNPELKPLILEIGAEAVINEVLLHHRGASSEAKSALRDLGCKVKMEEPWTGKKGELKR